jgi:GntR family transcriptional regulator
MHITIDPTAAAPVSEQISEGIRFAIATGRVAPGDRLPSVRGLAKELLVNPNTVLKVYRDLEREGVVRTRSGSGVFVAPRAKPLCRKASVATVRAAVMSAVAKGLAAGLDAAALAQLVDDCLEEAGAIHDATY